MARLSSKPCLFCYIFVMSETKKLFKMGLSDVKEFMPDKPVTFDPEELSTADLSNYSYKGILFTLNEPEGDGFENEEARVFPR